VSDEPTPTPDVDEAPGWLVLDPDGNVVDSGPIVDLTAVADTGEPEQEQQ
jgi:hypothetical protein